ncbi:AAA family ATPase [Pseudomarimonas salicorniae]|uniref:MoxR family ATPase n=1 Tax=Pseudomarimonas salicorniae TaxID=2933270 RepID=A0ABT0GJ41_9GAMM|nr:MoxR family ATPase [Lysobacter sp. CAU 1642]MCK7594559.1 MoxR family ATPase [Lysobacter sp. CAU 1642]
MEGFEPASLQSRFSQLREGLAADVVGQPALVHRLLLALLADGHLLVEGAPGLAKTTAIKELASRLEADFQRIQFTPDLLPADLTGTDVFRPQEGRFEFQQGPVFHNLLLADEVNRAPAKVQSALLEAMGERQVSVGRTTYPLPELFLVMAPQNPIEQEGTYPLPEAQLDRFLLHVCIDYPDADAEVRILELARRRARGGERPRQAAELLSTQEVLAARAAVLDVHLAPQVEQYLVELVQASRKRSRYGQALHPLIAFGASPRGSIALDRCARANAWLDGRDFVTPDDVQSVAIDVLQHRILLSYEAEAEGTRPAEVVRRLLQAVPAP